MSYPIHSERLSKKFRSVAAVNELDLEVPEGSIYALVGPNGAGKTTLLKILMNILRPDGGRAAVLNVDSRRLRPQDIACLRASLSSAPDPPR